ARVADFGLAHAPNGVYPLGQRGRPPAGLPKREAVAQEQKINSRNLYEDSERRVGLSIGMGLVEGMSVWPGTMTRSRIWLPRGGRLQRVSSGSRAACRGLSEPASRAPCRLEESRIRPTLVGTPDPSDFPGAPWSR